MKRFLALASALGLAVVGTSACDASPPAVSVNGQVLTVAGLNAQLAQWTSDKAFVAALDQSAEQNASQGGGQPQTVAGAGGRATYSSNFTNQVLQFNISSIALQQYVNRHGGPATPEMIQTARAYEQSNPNRATYWDALPESLRELFVNFLANEGVLTPAPSDLSQLQQTYTGLAPAIFSSVCVIEGSSPDQVSANAVVASGTVTGAQVCFDQQQMEAQPQAFQQAVIGLTKVGQIAPPLKTSFGYQVIQLNSRATPPLDAGVARVLAAASSPPNQLSTIVTTAKVQVNAAYGTWTQGCLAPPGETPQQACGSQQ